VSSTHALRGRLSRRSEISSRGDWVGWEGATSSVGVGYEVCLCFASLVGLATGTCLGPIVTLSADFAVLPFFLVVVTSSRVGLSVTETGGVWRGRNCSLDNTASTDYVIPAGTQALLFCGRLCPLCLRDGGGWVGQPLYCVRWAPD
jgi:hypothetical protein